MCGALSEKGDAAYELVFATDLINRVTAAPLPPEDGVGGHDQEGLPPPGPDAGQPDPQEAICPPQPWPWHRSLVHGELVTQGEVLEGELAVAAAEERGVEAGGARG